MAVVRALALLCLLVVAIEACNFSRSCTEITNTETTIHANCLNSANQSFKASIDVNQCIGSNNGQLDCSSNFLRNCTFEGIFGITLRATCKKNDGTTMVSNKQLDDCIQNVEGKLECC